MSDNGQSRDTAINVANGEYARTIALISQARTALAEAQTLGEVRKVKEWVGAARDLSRRLKRLQGARSEAVDSELDAAELWIDAYRSEGVVLNRMHDSKERARRGQRPTRD